MRIHSEPEFSALMLITRIGLSVDAGNIQKAVETFPHGNKGKKRSPQQREAMRRLMLKRPREWYVANGARCKGFKHSEETRAKMSEAHKGKKRSPESIAKTTAALNGRRLSEQSRQKIAASRRGQKLSDAARAAISRGHVGLKRSKETIDKATASLRRYWSDPVVRKLASDRKRQWWSARKERS